MTQIESVFWGTVAGVLTAAFVAFLKLVFQRIVIPWFEDLRYKGVRLEGEWTGTNDTTDFTVEYRLTLKQKANKVTGVLKIAKNSKSEAELSETLDFSVEGSMWEGFLSFTTKSADDTRLAFGSDLYQIKEGGRKLDGIHIYRSLRRDCVSQIPVVLRRS